MKEIRSPHAVSWHDTDGPTIFLAGSIEGGNAPPWQAEFVERFKGERGTIVNPRRKDWNPEHSKYRHPALIAQIQWELKALSKVDLIFMYFAPGTISPISLLEQGWFGFQHGKEGNMITVCPPEYFRATNVEVFCEMVGIDVHLDLCEGYDAVEDWLEARR